MFNQVYNEPLKALIVDVFIDKHVSVIERFIFHASSSQTFDDIFQSVLNEFYDSHPETKELHDEKIKESSSVLVYVSSCNNKETFRKILMQFIFPYLLYKETSIEKEISGNSLKSCLLKCIVNKNNCGRS